MQDQSAAAAAAIDLTDLTPPLHDGSESDVTEDSMQLSLSQQALVSLQSRREFDARCKDEYGQDVYAKIASRLRTFAIRHRRTRDSTNSVPASELASSIPY